MAVVTTAQLSTQTVDMVIPLKVSNDPLTTRFNALLLISTFPEVSASPVETVTRGRKHRFGNGFGNDGKREEPYTL